jgi:uncharacterized hydrophobic protein (TIGR00271 family)
MGPIMGAGMSLAIGDLHWFRESARALAVGTLLAILFCALIVLLSPLQTVTSEIAARTRPNLFDLAVAFFSAVAGAYAMIRSRDSSIVGVAIATALMPPLAVVGFGLATWNWAVFGGALLLFFTNLMTIALVMAAMARLYGFRTNLSERQTFYQNVIFVLVFIGLAVPLGYSLRQIAWEAQASATANGAIKDVFGAKARISAIEFDFDANPISVRATVLTPRFMADAQAQTSATLSRTLGAPVDVVIEQFRVGTGAGEANAAQVAVARMREQQLSTEREVEQMGERMALVAGVTARQVTIDVQRRRAMVKATILPGAQIAAYRLLESRVAAFEPDWDVRLIPPAIALPTISLSQAEPDEAGEAALADIIWAAQRIDTPIGLNGPMEAVDTLITRMKEAEVRAVRSAEIAPVNGSVSAGWLAPDAIVP